MAISSINSVTKLRLTGLSSGLDTDMIIRSMMQLEQLKINRQYRAKTTLLWRQEALNSVAGDLKLFRQDFMSILSSKNLMTESAYNAYKAEVSGKNANAVSISTTVHANPGKVTINRIVSLAKETGVSSGSTNKAVVTAYGTLNPVLEGETPPGLTTKLGDLNFQNDLEFDGSGNFSVKINGETFTFNENDTVYDMMSTISGNRLARVDAYFDWSNGGLVLTAKDINGSVTIEDATGNSFGANSAFGIQTGTYEAPPGISAGGAGLVGASQTMLKDLNLAQPLEFVNDEISFKINGQSFTFKNTDTLGKMMSTINGNEKAGVMMSYSELTDRFTVKTKETGTATSLAIQNVKGNAFGGVSAFGIAAIGYANGSDAVAVINDTVVTRAKNSFSIDGINYTLNKVTEPDDDPIEITISRDVAPVIEKIKSFIDGYNTLIKKLEGLLKDRKTLDEQSYVPLTDDEKADMSEKQIEQWEEIAKKGILRNNSGIQTLVSRLRGALFESVTSAGLSPADIGLTTGDYYQGTGGQIKLDEDRLRSALESNPEAVMMVFADMSSPVSPDYQQSGFLTRVGLIIDDYTKSAGGIALDSIEYSLRQVNDKITTMQKKMQDKEEKLYKQYAAMETALAKIQSQSEWLSGVLGSTSGK